MSSTWQQRDDAQPPCQKSGKRNRCRQPKPKDVKCTTTEEPAGPQPKDEKSFTNQEPAEPQLNLSKFSAQFDRISVFAGQFVRFEKDTDQGIRWAHVKMAKFDVRQIKKIIRHNARAQQVQKPKKNYIDADLLPPSDSESEDASELPTTANPNQGNRLYEIYTDYPQDDEEEEE